MKKQVTITLDENVISRVHEVMGDVPFSRWVERAVRNRLEEEKKGEASENADRS